MKQIFRYSLHLLLFYASFLYGQPQVCRANDVIDFKKKIENHGQFENEVMLKLPQITPDPHLEDQDHHTGIEMQTSVFQKYTATSAHNANLKIDTAYFHINLTDDALAETLELYTQSVECWKCPLQRVAVVGAGQNIVTILANTTHKTQLALRCRTHNSSLIEIWSMTTQFGEWGEYTLFITPAQVSASYNITLAIMEYPHWSTLPILVSFCIYLVMALIWLLITFLHRYQIIHKIMDCWHTERLVNADLGSHSAHSYASDTINAASLTSLSTPSSPVAWGTVEPPILTNDRQKQRLRSLDTFRGLSIAVMIFVNYGGGKYWFFKHARWNGLTVADLVFPWFMWIMGVSIMLSVESQVRKKVGRTLVIRKMVWRSVKLFALGLMLNSGYPSGNDLEKLRIPGVLQRFSLCYLIVAILVYLLYRDSNCHQHGCCAAFRDVRAYWLQWLAMLVLLAVHFCLTFLLEVPDCGKGYLGPGGISEHSTYENCTGGAAGYIDRLILGVNHMYSHGSEKKLYQTATPYDPEGILGTLSSAFLVFLGVQAGKIVSTFSDHTSRIVRFLLWALITGGVSLMLCNASANDGWIPVNKNLWSVSYVLGMAGSAFLVLAIFYWLIDVAYIWNGSPFYQPGMNSIFLYLGSEVFGSYLPWSWVPFTVSHAEHLAMDLWGVSLWVAVGHYLHYIREYFVL
ncbi:PREDICTED: heparan-alpha-glucosaminide N-acetyltransferase-like [Priapulus caudatus]|uniref:Heparan-alpha-glucosaminide N-acetyltransferase-like n=1 Tax=Priapulus caudatus TaxID=37621 RepID=A0ABM1FA32_PRICU|nr:PREDICTED: heparan-alpha-glucosaminide N-acetyltransferase-like [Priapulus caudatus]